MDQNLAVLVENATKIYNDKEILNNFSMHVPKHSIYGLLGASGCGKTTLLNCLVGIKRLNSGKICVLDKNIDLGGFPFSQIGYMPQEIGLTFEFTIKEAVCYFAKIFGISYSMTKEKFSQLSKLLDLPSSKKIIAKCSGGEQRRISFAIALINSPELLILDEPTVGLDPILREVIWNYLLQITKLQDTTVIITTHYIEEARKAQKVGFMREGRLLAEDSPENLLSLYESNSLESVFLILSKKQAQNINNNFNGSSTEVNNIEKTENTKFGAGNKRWTNRTKEKIHQKKIYCKRNFRELSLNKNRLKALLIKNFTQLSRNKSGTIFTFLIPLISLSAFLIAVGNDIKNINVAIVNEENQYHSCGDNDYRIDYSGSHCNVLNLGCKFIAELDDSTIVKNFFDNTTKALNELQHGNVWGVVYIPSNFSQSFQKRIEDSFNLPEDTVNSSQIIAWVDISNHQIGVSLKYILKKNMLNLHRHLLSTCNYSSNTAESIVQLKDVFYGQKNDKFTSFLIPGILLTIIFFMSVTNTVDTILTDRLGGTWYRSSVAGVSSLEIILTHFVTQFSITIIQVLEILTLTFFIYKTDYNGNLFEIILVLILGGIVGMSYGLFISVACENHSTANFLTTGSFYPLVIVSGVLWPLEGMAKFLQYCALGLPIALPTLSLRNIMKKGWNLNRNEVLNGVAMQIFWIVLLGTICVYQLKKKN